MRKIAALLAMLLPTIASAADMQYVVYDAFDETVMAFQRLALITGDSVFVMIAGCFVAASIVFASLYFGAQGTAKQGNNPAIILVQLAVGLALFFGAVVPKGRIFVYDAFLNKTQAVGGIPDIIVFFAGGMNAVEREVTRIVETAAATPYSNDLGATGFSLIYATATTVQGDADLERSIGQYVMDCGLTAIGTGQSGTSLNELLRNSTDLRETLNEYTHPAWPTTYFPPGNSGGVPGTCADAWNYLRPILDNVSGGPVADLKNKACKEAGFDIADASQATRCDALHVEAAELFGVAPSNSGVFLRNFIVARGIQNMLLRPDFTAAQGALVNRSMMAESMGTTEALGQWVPRLRALMLAIVLGIIPIPLLFVATNLVYKAVGLVIGLFAFMTIWGITDAVSVQMARDVAAQAFQTIKDMHVGFESLMLAPPASLKALALYGKYRMMALGLAGLIASALFKVSSSAFSSVQSAGSDLANKGAQAGTSTATPEGLQSTLSSSLSSTSALSQMATAGGATSMSLANRQGMEGAMQQAMYIESAASSGGRPGEGMTDFMQTSAAGVAGGQIGANKSLSQVSAELGMPKLGAASTARYSRDFDADMSGVGTLQGKERAASFDGVSTGSMISGAAAATSADGALRATSGQSAAQRLFGGSDGDLIKASFEGEKGAATAAADKRLAGLMQGGDQLTKLSNLAVQQNASQAGLARATGGDPNPAERSYQTGHELDLAKNKVIENSSGGAAYVGKGQGRDSVVSAAGTNRVADSMGMPAMAAGDTLAKATSAGAGTAANQAGGAISVGRQIGTQRTVADFGNARVRQAAAESLAGSGIGNRVRFEEMANGNMQAVLHGDDLKRFVSSAVSNGMDPQAADNILRKGAARVEMGFDKSSGVVTATASGNFRTQTGTFASDENGSLTSYRNDQVVSNTSTRSYGPQVNGAAGLFNDTSAMSNELLRAYSGNILAGSRDSASFDALASTLAQGLSSRGTNSTAGNTDTQSYGWNAGLSGSLGTGSSRLGIGVGGGLTAQGGTADAADIRQDLNTSMFRDAITGARSQAVAEWSQRNPGQPVNVDDPIANKMVAERTAELVQAKAQQFEKAALSTTSDAADMNDAMGAYRDGPGQSQTPSAPLTRQFPSGPKY